MLYRLSYSLWDQSKRSNKSRYKTQDKCRTGFERFTVVATISNLKRHIDIDGGFTIQAQTSYKSSLFFLVNLHLFVQTARVQR